MAPAPELQVDISDALSERDRVRFTVHTRTTLPEFAKPELSVVRQHEEFIWLHECLEDNEAYTGYIIPPAPSRPDFDSSREKLQRLGEGEGTMTKEEFTKMKQDLEAEYLATFKKTVAMHEVFLQRLASHSKFMTDPNFKIFLEYENELSVRPKNKREKLTGFISNISRSAQELAISTSQDFFEQERARLALYYNGIKDVTTNADRMTRSHRNLADSYLQLSSQLAQLANTGDEDPSLKNLLLKLSDFFERSRKVESRIATDEDLKLSDTFRYYKRDTTAAQDLLMRRLRYMAEYESAKKASEKARSRHRHMQYTDVIEKKSFENFETISELAKQELQDYKQRRVAAFKKNFSDLVELELKHVNAQKMLIKSCLDACKAL